MSVKKKLKRAVKKAAPLLAVAGLGRAFMNARNRRNQMKDFLATEGGDLSDMSNMVKEFGVALVRSRDAILANPVINRITDYLPMKKGGRVGCGIAKKGFGKAMKRRKK